MIFKLLVDVINENVLLFDKSVLEVWKFWQKTLTIKNYLLAKIFHSTFHPQALTTSVFIAIAMLLFTSPALYTYYTAALHCHIIQFIQTFKVRGCEPYRDVLIDVTQCHHHNKQQQVYAIIDFQQSSLVHCHQLKINIS